MRKKLNMLIMSLLSLLMLTACGGDEKVALLYEKLPADADVVAVVNLKTVVEAAGGKIENTTVNLPKLLLDSLSENGRGDVEYYTSMLSSGYVDPNSFALMWSYADSNKPILVMTLTDPDMFVKMIHRDGFLKYSDETATTYYTATRWDKAGKESYPCYAIINGHVYYLSDVAPGSATTPADVLSSILSRVREKPLAKSPAGEFIMDGEAVGIMFKPGEKIKEQMKKSDAQKLQDGTLCLKGGFEGEALKLTGKIVATDGTDADISPLKDLFDANGAVNGKALLGEVVNSDSVLLANINTANGLKLTGNIDAEDIRLEFTGGGAKGIVDRLLEIIDSYAYPAPPAAPETAEPAQ